MFEIMNLKEVRKNNESLILYLLNANGAMSRKDIAKELNLTPAAITKITSDLIREGVIREVGSDNTKTSKVGRKEINIEINIKDKVALCLNLENDKITISLAKFNGDLIGSEGYKIPEKIEDLVKLTKDFLTKFPEKIVNKIYAIGLCLLGSNNEYSIWQGVDLKKIFEKEFNTRVVVKNNIAAFAEAELIYNKNLTKTNGNVLVFKWGPGIGSSIIYNGKVTDSNGNETFEIGHCMVNSNGVKCRCGRIGCLETEAQIPSNMQREKYEELVVDKSKYVATALENAYTLISAKKIILFGKVFDDEFAYNELMKRCKYIYENFNPADVEISKLNDVRSYIGAVAICAKRFFFDRVVEE
ncbi:MAG: ROK family transcriptional regulator [Clostridia bacterium]|nr:ROK family transcriptional regulator [Clostridia bacterium]